MKKGLLMFMGLMCLLFISIGGAYAQTTVTGVVTDENGEPLPGVTILVEGTSVGTATDVNGAYSLEVPDGKNLVFKGIGYTPQIVPVDGQSTIDLSLSEGVTELTDVVVTAQGIETERVALGYAVSTVTAKDLEALSASEGDLGRLLRGKAAGLNVTQNSGLSGSGTNINIRGFTSITGTNEPLFIVDGVPFNGGANEQSNFIDGTTESSRFLDLDANNIANVEVLKGLSATALYGDRGRNGVILITTKNSSSVKKAKKTEVTLSQSFFATNIASLPKYQNNYGNGFYNTYGQFFSNYGPQFGSQYAPTTVPHPYDRAALALAFPQFTGAQYDYKAYENNVKDFFRTGLTRTTSVGISGGSENASFSATYTYLDDIGFTPGNEVQKNTIGIGGRVKLTNKLVLSSTFNYANTNYKSPPVASSLGSGSASSDASSVFGDVLYTPRSIDLMNLPFQNPITGGSVYYRGGNDIQNPRWTVENSGSRQKVDRFFGQASLVYEFKSWLSLQYRVGIDSYTEANTSFQNKGAVDGNINGYLRTTTVRNQIINHDIILNFNKRIGDNFNVTAILGFNNRTDRFDQVGIFSSDQQVFGVQQHFAFKNHSNQSPSTGNLQVNRTINRIGFYFQGVVGFKDYLYVTLTGRYDQGNTVESQNRAIFYPAASVAFDFAEALGALRGSDVVNLLKLRFGYGTSANFPGAYQTRQRVNLNSQAFVGPGQSTPFTTNSISNVLANPDLKPERLVEIEAGIEAQLFKSRISFDLSVYQKNTRDLILDRSLDPSTGYTTQSINAGETQVRGLEIEASALAVKLGDFRWNVSAVYNMYKNIVVSLPEGITQISTSGFTNLGNFAIPGQPFNVMQGSYVQRDANGNRLVGGNGQYLISNDIKIIGDPNPTWTGTLGNTFSWKGLSLYVELQYQQGGSIYSQTAATLLARGLTADTDVDRNNTIVLPGVTADGQPNKTQIALVDYYFSVLGLGADEFRIWDASNIRLNEVTLSYSLPKSILEKTPFGNIQISATGYNLWYNAFNMPKSARVDPNNNGTGVGNGRGFEFLNGPSVRKYGVTVKLTF